MSEKPKFWFPRKRYGWGWGLPVRWQGWAVFLAYLGSLSAGVLYFRAQRNSGLLLVFVLLLTVTLVAIVVAKGERPVGWRWGRK